MSKKNKGVDILADINNKRTIKCGKYSDIVRGKDALMPEYPIVKYHGRQITKDFIYLTGFREPFLVDSEPSSIDIIVPDKEFTLHDASRILGDNFPIKVIEVGCQQQLEGWTVKNYAKYFHGRTKDHKILNLISLEFSGTPLSALVKAPRVVRELDWIEVCWPQERKASGYYPRVQKYLLVGMAGAYTDFHLDFGGTSVWYHVLWGRKRFYVIPPTARNLQVYLDWTCSKQQDQLFLGDLVDAGNCLYFDLTAGNTLFLPGGWIHAVYTPEDSLVFGGNFLLTPCIFRQLQGFAIEIRSQVGKMYRFPNFKQLNWFALMSLLPHAYSISQNARDPESCLDWLEFDQIEYKMSMIRQLAIFTRCCGLWVQSLESEDETTFMLVARHTLIECGEKLPQEGVDEELDSLLSSQVLQLWWTVLIAAANALDKQSGVTIAHMTETLCQKSCLDMTITEFVWWVRGNKEGDGSCNMTGSSWGMNLLDSDLTALINGETFKCFESYNISSEPGNRSDISCSKTGGNVKVGPKEEENVDVETAGGDAEDFEFDEEDLEEDCTDQLMLRIPKKIKSEIDNDGPLSLVLKVEKPKTKSVSTTRSRASSRRVRERDDFITDEIEMESSDSDSLSIPVPLDDNTCNKRYRTRGKRLSAAYLNAVADADIEEYCVTERGEDEEYTTRETGQQIPEVSNTEKLTNVMRNSPINEHRRFEAEAKADNPFQDEENEEDRDREDRDDDDDEDEYIRKRRRGSDTTRRREIDPPLDDYARVQATAPGRKKAVVSVRQQLMKKMSKRR